MSFNHSEPVDSFWMVGGLPHSKLKQLEKAWQKDTAALLEQERVEAERRRVQELAKQREEHAAEADRKLHEALESQEKE